MVIEVLLILFLFSVIFFLIYFYLAFFTGAPFVPTPMSIINEVISFAKITDTDIVFDLGSGDGRLLIAAAQEGAEARGWEINPSLVWWTKLQMYSHGVQKKVSIYCKDYRKADLRDATIVFLYNLPPFLPELEKKFHKELSPGTKIISYKFPLSKFKLKKQSDSGIFMYLVK